MRPHIDDIVATCVSMADERVPFVHGGRSRDGVDCGGLLVLALRECGVDVKDWPTPYVRMVHESRLLLNLLRCRLDPIDVASSRHGDVLVAWWDRVSKIPQHLMIRSGSTRVVHAYTGASWVAHATLSKKYLRRVTHAFRLPDTMVRRA